MQGALYRTSCKQDGNMSSLWGMPREAARNRELFLREAGVYAAPQCEIAGGFHGGRVEVVEEATLPFPARHIYREADALLTRSPHLALLLMTGDCLPVVICEPEARCLALVHAGWQGADARVAEKAVRSMQERFGAKPARLRVWVGPSIKAASYVQRELAQKDLVLWKPYLEKTEEGWRIDLLGYVLLQLREAGVPAKNMEISSVDTATDPAYFSHWRSRRTGEPEGRMLTVAKMRVD